MSKKIYISPLAQRYSSLEMLYNFSSEKKFRTWRRLWTILAEVERDLGLPISRRQIAQLKEFQDKINYKKAEELEQRLGHDVMAHIKAYGLQAKSASPIIHLGATSAFVVDNTDLILVRDGLIILKDKLLEIVDALLVIARRFASTPTVAYTHLQPAQLTTVGKRVCLWLVDLVMDLDEIDGILKNIKFLGVKGAVGTQASFLALFDGDEKKVKKLDKIVAKRMGFGDVFTISSQTYTRKIDLLVHNVLASCAQSAHKFSNDLRFLAHLGEIEEPFGKEQVGSSAMAYKRNPVLCERMASLARFVIVIAQNAVITASNQFLERTLDDSAGKRIATPEAFLALDGTLNLYLRIVKDLVINEDVIRVNVEKELPFIATENILMVAVKRGGDRQRLHERLRLHSLAVRENLKKGLKNDLLERIRCDPEFACVKDKIPTKLDVSDYIGRAGSQVIEFIEKDVRPRIIKKR